jgi:hypothetical protein
MYVIDRRAKNHKVEGFVANRNIVRGGGTENSILPKIREQLASIGKGVDIPINSYEQAPRDGFQMPERLTCSAADI